jgi:hypothetical protein
LVYKSLKGVFTGALRAVETRLGKEFPQYSELRSEILRIGNDAIREMNKCVHHFNIEMIPDTLEIQVEQGSGQGVEKDGKKSTG